MVLSLCLFAKLTFTFIKTCMIVNSLVKIIIKMDRFAMEAFLYTSDFGEDAYLFNSSSSSDSEDDVECICSDELQSSKKPKLDGYAEIEVPTLNEYDFRNNFRVTRSTFAKILELVQDAFISEHRGGRERVNPEKGTYILLWYLGNQETFKQMSERFKKTMSCIHHIVKVGTKTLSSKMYEQIMWPSTQEYPSISNMFQNFCHINRCIGVLGVSYIKIPKPKEGDGYMCSRNYHCMGLQGAVTVNGKFMDIYISEGSNEPEHILAKSSLPEEADKDFFGEYYLVGFNKYICRSWLVQPFTDTGTLTPAQKFFNGCHETAANIFPDSLGLLKGRFRRLQHFENRDIPFVVQCVEAACTLHNLAIDCDEENTNFFFSDPGIFDNSLNDPQSELISDGGTRMKVFQELIRADIEDQ